MKILSIETSCDDTAITIMEARLIKKQASFKILANTSNSQIAIHAPYGGVFPALAKREHIKNLPILLEEVLKKSFKSYQKTFLNTQGLAFYQFKKNPGIDLITVTYGPGLEPSLWSGIAFAKDLAKKWSIPLMPVNHMEGHIFSVFAKNKGNFIIPKINYPFLSLLVSGGHTELVLSKNEMKYKIVGETLDDAVGEAYDKVARMMSLPYPGGPKISKLAEIKRKTLCLRSIEEANGPNIAIRQQANMRAEQTQSFSLPRPMMYSKNLDFSFSGLKTAVLYLIKKIEPLSDEMKSKIALEFENAVSEVLVYKTLKAIEKYKIKTLIVAGGVACNTHLQRQIKKAISKNIKLLFPKKELSGDNSIMIGVAGFLKYIKNNGKINKNYNFKAKGNLRLK